MLDTAGSKKPIGEEIIQFFFKLPRLFSLSEWFARLMRLPRIRGEETKPGLVLIQIDGLSRKQLNKAFADKKAPFLKGLIENNFYRLHDHYPGLPASTPSVQGELFYGVKQIVPGFAFFDKESGKVFRMYESDAVLEIERRLVLQGQGLLEGGSSFSNIFRGGALESHFCVTSLGLSQLWKDVAPFNAVILALTHLPSMARIFALIVLEFIFGIFDFARGILKEENFIKEFQFIYVRALICILLRDLASMGAKIDIARGLPIIHLNLIGYDEVAHNRGPSSKAAYWSLQGIDRAIAKIYRDALHSPHRSYDVWIYSDHGQEDSVSYAVKHKKNVEDAVAEVLKGFDAAFDLLHIDKNVERLQRIGFLGFPFTKKNICAEHPSQCVSPGKKLVVTAFGPKGDIYLPRKMSKEEMRRFARELVAKAEIPVVMLPEEKGIVRVWTEQGEFTLPKDSKEILGDGHPNLAQLTQDLINLCHHPDAGGLTFMGFRPGHKPMTFPVEHGSHAGPGLEETNGFALLPIDVIPRKREQTYLTPTDLRFAVLRFLKRQPLKESKQYFKTVIKEKNKTVPGTLRVMTYNVHSCIGTDGKVSPERIARAIGRYEPDIVALQELDMGRKRTGGVDQPHLIAKELEMSYRFNPLVVVGQEQYGIALLSRYPMELIRAGRFEPVNTTNHKREPRGCIWADINIEGVKISFFNTHLGIFPRERIRHLNTLLGPEWLAHPDRHGPVILCGDLNSFPYSRLYLNISKVLRDAQKELDDHKPKATFFSHYPIARIDHVFVSPEFEVARVEVSRTDLDKIASDHLPLIVDLKINRTVEIVDEAKRKPD